MTPHPIAETITALLPLRNPSQVMFIYIALHTVQIASKSLT